MIAPADDVLLSREQRTVVVGRIVVRGESGDLVPVGGSWSREGSEGVDFARTSEVGDGPKREHEGGQFRFDDLTMQRRWRGARARWGIARCPSAFARSASRIVSSADSWSARTR